jgi:type VI protein secretion system component Hcp
MRTSIFFFAFVAAVGILATETSYARDHASGLPTGKRMHKPVTVTKELDKSSTSLPASRAGITTKPVRYDPYKNFKFK